MKNIVKILCLILLNNVLVGGTTGKLTGLVKDSGSGDPLIGCNIILEGTYTGTSSNENGEFTILNIPPNNYTVRFEMIGYKKLLQEGVSISSDKTTYVEANMETSVISGEEVVVLAERKLIQFDVTQSEAIITSDELEGRPVTEVS